MSRADIVVHRRSRSTSSARDVVVRSNAAVYMRSCAGVTIPAWCAPANGYVRLPAAAASGAASDVAPGSSCPTSIAPTAASPPSPIAAAPPAATPRNARRETSRRAGDAGWAPEVPGSGSVIGSSGTRPLSRRP